MLDRMERSRDQVSIAKLGSPKHICREGSSRQSCKLVEKERGSRGDRMVDIRPVLHPLIPGMYRVIALGRRKLFPFLAPVLIPLLDTSFRTAPRCIAPLCTQLHRHSRHSWSAASPSNFNSVACLLQGGTFNFFPPIAGGAPFSVISRNSAPKKNPSSFKSTSSKNSNFILILFTIQS